MKTLRVIALLAILAAGALVSCSLFGAEFVGTWTYSAGGQTESLVFTTTTFQINDSGIMTGSMSMNINTYDEAANHIQATVTSTSGAYTVIPNGTIFYISYAISGNTMQMAQSTITYGTPSGAAYTKQ